MKLGRLAWPGALALALGVCGALPGLAHATGSAFAPVPGSPYQSGFAQTSVAISPSGRLLTSGGYFDGATMYSVDPTSGALTSTTTFLAGTQLPVTQSFSASGRLLAADIQPTGNEPATGDEIFSVTKAGAVRRLSALATDGISDPGMSTFGPAGNLLALAEGQSARELQLVSIDPATGAPVAESNAVSTGGAVTSMAFSPTGAYVATTDYSGGVHVYAVGSSPTLTLSEVKGSPFSNGDGQEQVSASFSPTGGLLAVADVGLDADNHATVYSVHGRSGRLTPVASVPCQGAVAFNRGGRLLAVNSAYNGPIDFYDVDQATDSITPSSIPPLGDASDNILHMTFGGGVLAVAGEGGSGESPSGQLSVFKR